MAEIVVVFVFAALPVATAAAGWWFFRRLRGSGRAERPTGRQLAAGNALILLFLLSVGMLAGECYLRFVFDSTDTFGLLRSSDRWFERHYHKNSDSFRDDVEYDLGPVPTGLRRVTFIGDSFTAGHGVPDVADRFGNRVRAARPGWEVQVLAFNGFDTGPEVEFLAKRVPEFTKGKYEFDLVVLVYCLNDIVDILPEVRALSGRLVAAREKPFLARTSYLFDTLRFLWIANTDEDVGDYFPRLSAAYEGATFDEQKARLRELRTAVTSQGGKLAVVTFPMMNRLGADYPFRAAHEALDTFWRAEGVPHLDLLDTFAGRSATSLIVGRFDAHPNEEAHRLAAEAMLPFIEKALGETR